MTQRIGITGLPPMLSVSRSPRSVALDELSGYDWWRQAVAEAGDETAACIALLRDRADDPLLALAAVELERLHRRVK